MLFKVTIEICCFNMCSELHSAKITLPRSTRIVYFSILLGILYSLSLLNHMVEAIVDKYGINDGHIVGKHDGFGLKGGFGPGVGGLGGGYGGGGGCNGPEGGDFSDGDSRI
jgi:hypothetical protein